MTLKNNNYPINTPVMVNQKAIQRQAIEQAVAEYQSKGNVIAPAAEIQTAPRARKSLEVTE
jgi:hypothetical protein